MGRVVTTYALAAAIVAGCAGAPPWSVSPSPASTEVATSPTASPEEPTRAPRESPRPSTPLSSTAQRIVALESRLRSNRDDAAAWRDLGFELLQRVRETADPSLYDRAEAAFDRAAQLTPADDLVLVGRAQLAASRHDFTGALQLARRALERLPGFEDAALVEIDALIELGRYKDAFARIEVLATRDPDLPTLARLSYARELQGDLDGAVDAMRRARDAGTPTPEGEAYVTALFGDLLARTGRVDDARRAYDEALALVPGHPPSRIGLARLALRDGDTAMAIAELERAIAVLPLPEAVIALGEANIVAGQMQEAEDAFALARAELQLAQASSVVVDLELARFEADHGDPATALELARATYDSRETIFAADAVGWALHRLGRDAEARVWTRLALRLNTQDPLLLFHAGAIAAGTGDRDGARRALERALQLDPGFSATGAAEAADLLEQLGG